MSDHTNILNGRLELCLEIFEGIVNGVSIAHRAGIIHRDLKPQNILFIDKSLKNPLLSDFGICFLKGNEDRITDEGETVGARYFMAPEQERGKVFDVDFTVDIYALAKLFAYIYTNRFIYREEIDDAFRQDERESDPRINIIQDSILASCILENPNDRIKNAEDLLQIIRDIRKEFKVKSLPAIIHLPSNPSELKQNTSEEIWEYFKQCVKLLDENKVRNIKEDLVKRKTDFNESWLQFHLEVKDVPTNLNDRIPDLIASNSRAVAYLLAIADTNSIDFFSEYKNLIHHILKSSEIIKEGYLKVIKIPEVVAGYLYMSSTIQALYSESWEFLSKLLNYKFEYYYRAGRPDYVYGFIHPSFFYSQALDGSAITTHDLFRKILQDDTILSRKGINLEEIGNLYIKTQFLMSLKCVKLREEGVDESIWPDYGRYYGYRLEPFIDKIFYDDDYGKGIISCFGETKQEFFEKLNQRLEILHEMFGHNRYHWMSINKWEASSSQT